MSLTIEETTTAPADHFVERNGQRFAGAHLIVDMWGASRLDDLEYVEHAMRDAATAAGATILDSHMHHFSPNNGVTGMLILAESHISIHTWPEHGFAALDIFMCGETRPELAVEVMRQRLAPSEVRVEDIKRGLLR